jgi:tetratricopeptide (TPR) repeat protein
MSKLMPSLQEQYDDAMFEFSKGDYDSAIAGLRAVLAEEERHFEARLALGMALYRKGDYAAAIAEGHKAEQSRPHEQLVHTNLSLFYLKAGDKRLAEHHAGQARIASWKADNAANKTGGAPPADSPESGPGNPKASTVVPPKPFPEMPWKKKSG